MRINSIPLRFFNLYGLNENISEFFISVYTFLAFSTLLEAKSGTNKLPVEEPTNKSYCCCFSWIKYWAIPPAKAPLLPPPDITNAFMF